MNTILPNLRLVFGVESLVEPYGVSPGGRGYLGRLVDLQHISADATQGPSWGYLKVNYSETLSILGDKCP